MPTAKGFTGQRADAATGLDYYGARYYDPVASQFTSADTVASGLSPYAYVRGNPETLTDPTGRRYECPEGGCGGGGKNPPPSDPGSGSGNGNGSGSGKGSPPSTDPCVINPASSDCHQQERDNTIASIRIEAGIKIAIGLLITLAAGLWLIFNGPDLLKALEAVDLGLSFALNFVGDIGRFFPDKVTTQPKAG